LEHGGNFGVDAVAAVGVVIVASAEGFVVPGFDEGVEDILVSGFEEL